MIPHGGLVTHVPVWSILVASVAERAEMLDRLLRDLDRQATPFGGKVIVLVSVDDGTQPIGEKRTRLVESSPAEFVSFVDDDDWVSSDYVSRVMEALEQRPDYVGFRVHYTVDGAEQKQVVHSLDCGGWSESPDAYLRDISHINPIRREIAVAGLPFDHGFGEDARWADRVRATGLAQRQVFVDEILYHYNYRRAVSRFA